MLDLSRLNPPQRTAVTFEDGPSLVLAGAGSGKTRVIAHRIAWLVEQGVPPDSILAVTFTNKAAAEMRERVKALSGTAGKESVIATFHGFGLWFLRQEHEAAGLPRWFSICDAGDQVTIAKRCLADVSLDGRRLDVRRLISCMSEQKALGASGTGGARGLGASASVPPSVPDDDYLAVADALLPRYERALRAQRSVDFEDLIVRPVALLSADPSIRDRYRERFQHVLVDEFQDTNAVQLRLLELLCAPLTSASGGAGRARAGARKSTAKPAPVNASTIPPGVHPWAGRSLCAVGDDDQAIYGWRGADVRNILGFERYFPGAAVIRLEQNYRSTGRILECANGVISRSSTRRPKRLWTEAATGDPVRVVALPDEQEEARFVAGEVGRALNSGLRPAEIAVLYRLNAQSQAFEEAFREVGIPHTVKGGPAFFDRSEVRDILAWLKVCAFPQDDVSLVRAVNAPARGIGDVALERLGTWAAGRGEPVSAVLRSASAVPDIPRGAPERLEQLANTIERFRARFGPGRIAEPARMMFEELDFRAWLRRGVMSAEAGTRRAEAVDSVLRTLEWLERRHPASTLGSFLNRLALDSRDDEPEDVEGVALMTLHAAKGLEFPLVFLVGVEEDLLPVSGIQGEARDLEEERRLAYVGITRARQTLWITRATARTRRGRVEPRTPSRFLEDLPAGAHVRHDPESGSTPEATAARSSEVLRALRARLGGRN